MTLFQRTLLFAACFISFQVVQCFFTSSSTDLLRVVSGLPVFLFPCGFHSKACLIRMYLRHLLINVCSTRVVVMVTLPVSEPYSSTLFTLVLKILILFHADKDGVFHTVFKMLNACLAFPILFLTSSSVPPLSVTRLPR